MSTPNNAGRRRQRTESDTDESYNAPPPPPTTTIRNAAPRRNHDDDDDDDDDNEDTNMAPARAAPPPKPSPKGRRPRFRCVVVTLFNWHLDVDGNPTPLPEHIRPGTPSSPVTYVVWQQELTQDGRLHLQVYMEFSKQMTKEEIFKLLEWQNNWGHLEARKGNQQQAIEYCKKKNTRVPGTMPTELGHMSALDAKGGWEAVAHEMLENGATFEDLSRDPRYLAIACRNSAGILKVANVLNKPPKYRPVQCFYIHGPTGTGKTRYVYEKYGHDNVYTKPKCERGQSSWYDGYEGEHVLLLDEFSGDEEYRLTELLRMLDVHPYRCPVKGGFVHARWDVVCITSNKPLDEWYKGAHPQHLAALHRRIPNKNIIEMKEVPPQEKPIEEEERFEIGNMRLTKQEVIDGLMRLSCLGEDLTQLVIADHWIPTPYKKM